MVLGPQSGRVHPSDPGEPSDPSDPPGDPSVHVHARVSVGKVRVEPKSCPRAAKSDPRAAKSGPRSAKSGPRAP